MSPCRLCNPTPHATLFQPHYNTLRSTYMRRSGTDQNDSRTIYNIHIMTKMQCNSKRISNLPSEIAYDTMQYLEFFLSFFLCPPVTALHVHTIIYYYCVAFPSDNALLYQLASCWTLDIQRLSSIKPYEPIITDQHTNQSPLRTF